MLNQAVGGGGSTKCIELHIICEVSHTLLIDWLNEQNTHPRERLQPFQLICEAGGIGHTSGQNMQ